MHGGLRDRFSTCPLESHVPPPEIGIYFTSVKNKSGIVKQQSLALPRYNPVPTGAVGRTGTEYLQDIMPRTRLSKPKLIVGLCLGLVVTRVLETCIEQKKSPAGFPV